MDSDPDSGGQTSGSGSPSLAGRIGDVRWTNQATGKKHDLSFLFPALSMELSHCIEQCRLHCNHISTVDESATAMSYLRIVVVITLMFIYPET